LKYKFLIMEVTVYLLRQECGDLWLILEAKRGSESKKFWQRCCIRIDAAGGRVTDGRKSTSIAQKLDVIKRLDRGQQSMDIVAASILTTGLFLSERTNFRVLQQPCAACARLCKGKVMYTLEH
jgi:hypothetical protein